MDHEIECKFFIDDKNEIRKKLKNIGLDLYKPEFLMKRKSFGFADSNKWFRVKDEGNEITMTCKNINGKGINDVFEAEIKISDFNLGCEILIQAGLPEKSYQETYREIWRADDVEITIDTWPHLQSFIEIEAKNENIVKYYAKKLDFNFDFDAYFGGVSVLYNKVYGCDEKIVNNIKKFLFEDKELLKQLQDNFSF